MKKIFVLFFVLFVGTYLFAQNKSEIQIKTFFHCTNGKALLERELSKIDGIFQATANLQTKIVTIQYDETKQNKESLVKAIEKIGYLTEFSSKETKINKACSHDHEEQKEHHEHKHE